eukprot:9957269-Alexandrium_andersonii.AAC.1
MFAPPCFLARIASVSVDTSAGYDVHCPVGLQLRHVDALCNGQRTRRVPFECPANTTVSQWKADVACHADDAFQHRASELQS